MLVKIEQMAPVSSTVLIQGESGTGKELVARRSTTSRRGAAGRSSRSTARALPETLLESELFGHEKGAFTGAAERRLGRFELADTGTLFLDEIGEIPPATQVKLLRVLQEREFFRVGGTQPIKVDVRVVAATNRSLRDAVAQGEFREDLYYRLNVLSIYLPPLRERREDIPLLVRRFIRELARGSTTARSAASRPRRCERLVNAPWPGNVRELRNLVESMVVLAPGAEIRAADIPARHPGRAGSLLPVRIGPLTRDAGGPGGTSSSSSSGACSSSSSRWRSCAAGWTRVPSACRSSRWGSTARLADVMTVGDSDNGAQPVIYRPGMTMAEVEKAAIEAALQEHHGNRRRAAEVLGIGERTLYRKIKAYHLE